MGGHKTVYNKLFIIVLLLFSVIIWKSESRSQNFSTVLQAINRVEASLKQWVEEEAKIRSIEVDTLKKRLYNLENGDNHQTITTDQIEDMKTRVTSVEKSNQTLSVRLDKRHKILEDRVNTLETVNSEFIENLSPDKIQFLSNDLNGLLRELKNIIYEKQMQETEALALSGFFDLQCSGKDISNNMQRGMDYGQFEVVLSMLFHDYVKAEGAIAFRNGFFELGSGFVNFMLVNNLNKKNFLSVSNLGMMIGQFDIPFGIDYKCTPSPDRYLVTPPLVYNKNITFWNDLGINLYGSGNFWNFNVFTINGINSGYTAGGRIGIKFFNNLEIGGSYTRDFNEKDKLESRLSGFDLQIESGALKIKGEYISTKGLLDGKITETGTEKHAGYYIQTMIDIQHLLDIPAFAVFRYGRWKPLSDFGGKEIDNNTQNRFTLGLGYKIVNNVEIRSQYLLQKKGEHKVVMDGIVIQFVISF
jgi:hypothetical protein